MPDIKELKKMPLSKAAQKASNSAANIAFYKWFCQNHYDVPGTILLMTIVRSRLQIVIPKCMKPQDCKNMALKMLGPIGYTRDMMLARGMYFGQKNGDFRVVALVDTSEFIFNYAKKAINATTRAKILNKNLAKRYNAHKAANDAALIAALIELAKVKP